MRYVTAAVISFVFLVNSGRAADDAVEVAAPDDGLVELQDGAETAEGALMAFAAASRAGDIEASLKLVDPPIRMLLAPEIAIDNYLFECLIFDAAVSTKLRKIPRRSGVLSPFAQRDLVNMLEVKVLSTRKVDDDRTVLNVQSIDNSYHYTGTMTTIRQFLAVRREGRWYLFQPFGLMLTYLDTSPNNELPLISIKKNVEGVDFKIVYHVPIESIHEELVKASKLPNVTEGVAAAQRLDRYLAKVKRLFDRGEIDTEAKLEKALEIGVELVGPLFSGIFVAAEPVLKNLHQLPKTTDVETSDESKE